MILDIDLTHKKCSLCLLDLPYDSFSKCNNPAKSKSGLQSSCKPCIKAYQQDRYKNNKEEIDRKNKEWYENNRAKRIKGTSNYTSERMKRDPIFKMIRYLRSRTMRTLKSKRMNKTSHFREYIGCDPVQLRNHIEGQFKEGMNWENQGEWHVDHKVPLSSAKTTDILYELCHYTNLQPLWAHENLTKSNKAA